MVLEVVGLVVLGVGLEGGLGLGLGVGIGVGMEMEMEEMGMGVEVEKGLEVEMELEGMGKRYLQLIFYLMLKGLYLEEIHFSHVPWSLEHFVYGCKSLAFW